MSVAWPLQVAIVEALEARQPLVDLLGGGVHSGQAPKGTPGRYITLGGSNEGAALPVFGGRRSYANVETLHVYTPVSEQKEGVLLVYHQVEQALDGVELPLAGHEMVRGYTTLVDVLRDPGGEHMHGVVRYEVQSRRAA